MNHEQLEADILRELIPELEAEGYQVYLHPNRPIAPAFLGEFSADAIAIRGDKKLLIEVVGRSPHSEDKIKRLTELVKGQENWELRIVWVTPSSKPAALPKQSRNVIAKRIVEVRELISIEHYAAALLVAWATFEATARTLIPEEFGRPQTPGRIVEILAAKGEISPNEADLLRNLTAKRNSIIHGVLDTRITKKDVDSFAKVLAALSHSIDARNQG